MFSSLKSAISFVGSGSLFTISIISDNPIYADAMSTALQAMPIELALEYLEKNSNIRALILKKMPDSDRTETLINSL